VGSSLTRLRRPIDRGTYCCHEKHHGEMMIVQTLLTINLLGEERRPMGAIRNRVHCGAFSNVVATPRFLT
jgi:hypothetical protein